ncbi:divalent cation tolerance protein CutA [Promicromonospora sp. NFX87]|uniref:divalent cation tolerance protein CutA n=1 Tax=Promicromonospora sp. NFX87 TaxID=3402691 RepID=UPI003AFAA93F
MIYIPSETTEFCQITTTMSGRRAADTLARSVLDTGLAEHVQLDGGVTSYVMTSDGVDELEELRLTVRARTEFAGDVVQLLRSGHEYDPEDVVVDVLAILDGVPVTT